MPITTQEWNHELTARRNTFREIIARNGCDLALIYGGWGHTEPFRYLTNFTPVLGDAYGIVTARAMACVLNFTWQLIEARELSGIDAWYGAFDPIPTVIDQMKAAAPRRIAVIGLHRLPFVTYRAIQAAFPNAEFVDLGAEFAALRRYKSALEIRLLREAGHITDAAFDAIRPELKPGVTEVEVAARIVYEIERRGAGLSFEPTVVSGNDHPIPIRMPTERRLKPGDSVMIDIGAMVQGYQADATRTFVLGEPNAAQQKVWNAILGAYDVVFERIRPGVPCRDLHVVAVGVIEGAGYKLVHRIGHGIGLSTSFEWPSLDSETTPLKAGMTFCIEPGIYVDGSGDMKLEDDVVVTEDGYELLTTSRRDLAV
ncbi:MAG: aminopeptidase P family protein [Anaerolineae bacterium]|nr:aminopeptidase P family protein [Anaerolineae bacterium]